MDDLERLKWTATVLVVGALVAGYYLGRADGGLIALRELKRRMDEERPTRASAPVTVDGEATPA